MTRLKNFGENRMSKKRKPGSGGKRPGAGKKKKFGDVETSLIKFMVPAEIKEAAKKECRIAIDRVVSRTVFNSVPKKGNT